MSLTFFGDVSLRGACSAKRKELVEEGLIMFDDVRSLCSRERERERESNIGDMKGKGKRGVGAVSYGARIAVLLG
jgi:hypothetical protein